MTTTDLIPILFCVAAFLAFVVYDQSKRLSKERTLNANLLDYTKHLEKLVREKPSPSHIKSHQHRFIPTATEYASVVSNADGVQRILFTDGSMWDRKKDQGEPFMSDNGELHWRS